jgi:hypothetical protein
MKTIKPFLTDLVGERGFETLEKAIFHQRSRSVSDPLEMYLPLMVAPRALVSWVVQTVKPMKIGEYKDVKFPGDEGITIHFERQDMDVFRAEFVQGGKIIHTFDKQGIPAIVGHLMSIGEMYEGDLKTNAIEQKEEPKQDFSAIKHMLSMVIPEKQDVDTSKMQIAHETTKELTSVIGKLVDALIGKKLKTDKLEEELDKMAIKEVDGDKSFPEKATTPEEKQKEDIKDKENNPAIISEGASQKEMDKIKTTDSVDQEIPEIKKYPSPNDNKMEKENQGLSKESLKESKKVLPFPKPTAKKVEPLMKPYASDAQRRWAHTEAGTKALGGKEKVKHWDKESKGKDLPEKVSKEEIGKGEMPRGAGQPVQPGKPLPPVPQSKNPQAAAAKQAQASGQGKVAVPSIPKPQGPKMPAMKSEGYFRKKLNKSSISKSIKAVATSQELFKSTCFDCGRPEFSKDESGKPKFTPCACFKVLNKNEKGQPYKFVEAIQKNDGTFSLQFAPDADPETVKLFLLTLKTKLLLKKRGI